MSKNSPYIKTKLLKKLKKRARKRYKFEEVYTRNEQKQSVPLYQVLDMIYDDDYYRIIKKTTDRQKAWNFYISKYREIIFQGLDEYYTYYNKTPKSIHKKTEPKPLNVTLKTPVEFIVMDDVSVKQMSNKIKVY